MTVHRLRGGDLEYGLAKRRVNEFTSHDAYRFHLQVYEEPL